MVHSGKPPAATILAPSGDHEQTFSTGLYEDGRCPPFRGAGAAARAMLVDKGWTMIDGGVVQL